MVDSVTTAPFPLNTTSGSLCGVDWCHVWSVIEEVSDVLLPTMGGLTLILGLVGNTLVITAVLLYQNMQTPSNIAIMSLAAADLLYVLLFVASQTVTYIMSMGWLFGQVWCKLTFYAFHATTSVCAYTLLLMTLDRYLARVHPARSTSFRTNRNMWIAVFLVWLLNMAAHVPFMLPYQVVHTSDGDPICVRGYDCQQKPMAHSIFNASFFALSYVLPLVVIMVLFGLMIKHLFQLSVERCLQSEETSHSNNQVTRIVVIAVFIFAIFWMPFHVLNVLDEPMTRGDRDNETLTLMKVGWIVSQCLILMKSCINPILYVILSDSFRKSFQESLSLNRSKPCVQESDNLLGDKRAECETAAACIWLVSMIPCYSVVKSIWVLVHW